MIDNICILASLVAVAYVIAKAYVFNATQPWWRDWTTVVPRVRRKKAR